MYEMQIDVGTEHVDKEPVWVSIRPPWGKPYQYQTKAEAQRMMDMCYPETIIEKKRIIEVK